MSRKAFKIPIIPTIVIFIAIVIMTGLGSWQLQRADEKFQRIEQIEHRQQTQPMSLTDIIASFEDVRDFPIAVTGRFRQQPVFLIDNQLVQGKPGYHVLGILETDAGAVVINLGWVAAPGSRQRLPDIQIPEGLISIEGIVAEPKLNPMISETVSLQATSSHLIRLQQIDFDYIQRLSSIKVLPFVVLTSKSDHVEYFSDYLRDWKPVVMPPEKHIAYAIQWFGLAIALFIVYVVVLLRLKKEQRDDGKE